MRGPCGIWWWPCTGTMWTCSDVIPLRPVTELYLRTTAPGSGHQTGSLPPGCLEATTWGGVARLDPHPEIPAEDSRLDYVDAFTLLGDAMHPT